MKPYIRFSDSSEVAKLCQFELRRVRTSTLPATYLPGTLRRDAADRLDDKLGGQCACMTGTGVIVRGDFDHVKPSKAFLAAQPHGVDDLANS